MGSIDLLITIEKYPRKPTKLLTFLVTNCLSAYNIILGRTALNALQAVTSTYHLAMKFPTNQGVGIVRREQTIARECYVASLKEVKLQEAMIIEGLDIRDNAELIRGEPVEELVKVSIDPANLTKTTKIGSQLSPQAKADLIVLFAEHNDVFTWTHSEMLERNSFIAAEVDKLLKAKFIKNVDYPRLLSNVVLVCKNNGKWRFCVDYSDLTLPQRQLPFPRIDLLVNATPGHEMLSFMDDFSGYNQILMHASDQENNFFITDITTTSCH
ncbi:uncharacterized protein LOC114277009 [Camellia sinensis]|uniref:uncharacterized protein LOC114277009 n=1 Tax=Camellia sinensis TaxID=4442 RepID=UPI001035D1DE|nr:uncharacterized protein LOC114277009 [Camellia sinensis]